MSRPEKRVESQALKCVACGAPVELRGFSRTRTLACEFCGSTIDTSGEQWKLVERAEQAARQPPIALGTRGTLRGLPWELIGYMRRSVHVDGSRYAWDELLLFNPYHGFRYLLIQDGHFTLVEPLPGMGRSNGQEARYEGRKYRHFTSGQARVDMVLGEFPWEVRLGDMVRASDYVDPPYVLSEEKTEEETTWSRGEWISRDEVEAAFGQVRKVRAPGGVAPAQPNPFIADLAWMKKAVGIALLLWGLLSVGYGIVTEDKEVVRLVVPKQPATMSQQIDVSSRRDPATLGIMCKSGSLAGKWVMLTGKLVSDLASFDIGVGVGGWGSGADEILLADVPNGSYTLTLKREGTFEKDVFLVVRRDVSLWRYSCLACVLLLLVPIFVFMRYNSFEQRRWSESDHG